MSRDDNLENACDLCDKIVAESKKKKSSTLVAHAVYIQDMVLCETHCTTFPTENLIQHSSSACRVKPVDIYKMKDLHAEEEEDKVASTDEMHLYACYLLQSLVKPTRTYIGMTNNRLQRIRRHNGEIVGGAKATHANRPWRMSAFVDGFGLDQRAALRFEWSWKHPKQRKLAKPWYGRAGRINCAAQLLRTEVWSEENCGMSLRLFAAPDEECSLCLSDMDFLDVENANLFFVASNAADCSKI